MYDQKPDDRSLPELRSPQLATGEVITDPTGGVGRNPDYGGGDRLWKRYLSVLLRHKLLLTSIVALGTLMGLAAAFVLKPKYLAEATIWVQAESDGSQRDASGPFAGPDALGAYDWVTLLTSYAVLEDVVRQQRLYLVPGSPQDTAALAGLGVQPGFSPGTYTLRVSGSGDTYTLLRGDTSVVDRGQVGQPIGAELGLEWTPGPRSLHAGQTVHFTLLNPRDAARSLKHSLDVRMLEKGHFIRLRLEGTDPAEAAAIVNAVADRFRSVAMDLQGGHVTEVRSELKSQLDQAHGQLTRADSALETFQTVNATEPLDASSSGGATASAATNPVRADYFKLEFERDRIRRNREALQHLLDDKNTQRNVAAFVATIPEARSWTSLDDLTSQLAQKEQRLDSLSLKYTADHPAIQSLKADIHELESRTIPEAVRDLVATLQDRENELDAQIARLGTRLASIPPRAAEAARLQRTARIDGELYSTLKQRYDEVSLAADSRVSDVKIVDRAALSSKPVTDHQLQILLFAIVASFGLSVVGVLAFDRFDPHIRYPEEVSRGLGIAILGTIPHLKLGGRAHPGRDVAAEATEAFRGLRLSLAYAYGAAGPLILSVTSPGPGEGKSFVSMNLALSFARTGHRTLLVDGDVRRGRLHRTLQHRRRPGLMDYLLGQCSRQDVVRHTPYANLDLVPCGIRKQEAPELLAMDSLGEMLGAFRRDYEVVIVDTPPLGAGVDPLILGVATGHLLLVLRAGSSVRGLAEKTTEDLARLPVRVLGAVMNDVPAMATYPYYYSYLSDYTPTEEASGSTLVGA